MISNAEVRAAEWIIKQACQERTFCYDCPHYDNCAMSGDDEEGYPNDWDVPAPPSEPTERPRIEWLRMLPDDDAIKAINKGYQTCNHCNHLPNGTCFTPSEHEHCMSGYIGWWNGVVSLEQFRKEVGLND